MTEIAWRGELALDWDDSALFIGQIFLGQCWHVEDDGDYAPFDEHGDPIRENGAVPRFPTEAECKAWMVARAVQRLQNLELQKNMKIPVDSAPGAG